VKVRFISGMESVGANISNGLSGGREKKLRKKTEKCGGKGGR
jgi:hypothetical protein